MIRKFIPEFLIILGLFMLLLVLIISTSDYNSAGSDATPTTSDIVTEEPKPTNPTQAIKPPLPTETVSTEEPEEPTKEPEPEPELIMYFTEKDVIALAKVLYNECRGIPSDMEKACVGWTACNRVDAGFGNTIYEVLTAPNQFAYGRYTPVTDELYELALDVLTRWNNEKNGIENVGRVLPKEYLWFYGDGEHNYFRDAFSGNFNVWDYSLDNPYNS